MAVALVKVLNYGGYFEGYTTVKYVLLTQPISTYVLDRRCTTEAGYQA